MLFLLLLIGVREGKGEESRGTVNCGKEILKPGATVIVKISMCLLWFLIVNFN